jgi:hypothetical protein
MRHGGWARPLGWALGIGLLATAGLAQDEEAARLAALKEARAESILLREEGRGRPFDAAFRAEIKARLAQASMEALDLVDRRGYGLLPEPRALGDSSADLVYTPVAPCRIIDTRLVGAPLAAGFDRSFYVAGMDGFAGQGGSSAGCELPRGPATAAVVNFVAVNPSGPGNLRAWAYGGTMPNASVINYAAVGLNIANAVVVPLCDATTASCVPGDVMVRADASGTHLVADVVGYFRGVVKAQYRSFTASAVRFGLSEPLPNNVCSNTGGTQVTVVAAVAGRITVQAKGLLVVSHVNGVEDQVNAYIGTSATDCPSNDGLGDIIRIPAPLPNLLNWTMATHSLRVFDVAPGTHTYFLNHWQLRGSGNDAFVDGWLVATFHPN